MPDNRNEITRPNYGPRRAQSASSEFSLDQEATAHIPLGSDILLNFGRGRKRLHLQVGNGVDYNSARPILLGSTTSRFTPSHYVASFAGAPSMILAQMLTLDRPSPGGYSAATVFEPGALLDTMPTGTSFIEALYPAPTGITGYSGVFLGASATYADGQNVQTGNGPLASISLHTVDLQGTASPQTFTHLSAAATIPYYNYGRDHLGRTLRTLYAPSVDGSSSLLDMPVPDLQMLMMKMICTPDEWIARNGDGLRSLFRRIHNFSGDQLQFHLRKGFKARFFDRMNNTDLRIMGTLSHLGASLREGMPVRNCHADVFRTPSVTSQAVSVTFALADDDSVTIIRNGSFTGNAFAAEAIQTVVSGNIDEDTMSFLQEEVVNTTSTSVGGTSVTITSGMLDDITNFAHVSDRINPVVDGRVIGLAAHNASVNDFFVQIDDYVLGTERMAFSCIPQLSEHLAPGIFDVKDGESASRDYIYTDFKRGLEFIFDNCSADQASAWSTQMRWVRENFVDFKKGVMPDIYSTEARLDMDTIRHGWNLGLANLTNSSPAYGGYAAPTVDVSIGSAPVQNVARAIAGIDNLYNGGFINTNAVDTFVQGIDDLSKRDFLVGSDFTKGLQLVGDAKYTTYHRTTSDGIEHNVDVTVQPVAFGHWANIPMTWVADGTLFSMRTSVSGPGTRAIAANVFTGNTEFDIASFCTLPEPVIDALSLQESGNNLNLGMLCYVFTDALNYDVDGDGDFFGYSTVRELHWQDLTPLCHMPIPEFAAQSAAEAATGITWGNDALGLYRQTANMDRNDADATLAANGTLMYFFRDENTVELSPVSTVAGWYSRFDRLAKDITAAKSYSPFGTDGISINVEGANLVALASFSTGEPALQQMGDAIFTLAFCGINSGWSIEQRSVDRMLEDINIHNWSQQTGFDTTDYAMMMLPTEMDPSKMLTAFAATNLVCYNLGLVGAGAGHRPGEARSYHIDYAAVRTLYRSDAAFNGEVIEHSITLWEEAFAFYSEQPIDPEVHVINQLECQPGARRYRRLFRFLDPAAAHGVANSICSLFGLLNVPQNAGSIVNGLEGYGGEVNLNTIDVLHNQGTALDVALGHAAFRDDGSTTANMYGYWSTSDGSGALFGSNLRNGHFANVDFVRVMVERQRGIDNLYFKEAQLKLMLFDQDVFDHYTAVRSTMLYEYNRSMLIGPCPHLVIFNHEGQVLLDARDVAVTAIGAGQSAVTSKPTTTSSNDSAPSPEAPDDDRSARPGDEKYDD